MPKTQRRVDPAHLLTTAEVLERYSQLSRRTLDRLVAQGDLIYHRRGSRKRYWNPDDLNALWEIAE